MTFRAKRDSRICKPPWNVFTLETTMGLNVF